MSRPYQRVPFEALPEQPRVAHPFFELEPREVDVWCAALGDVRTSVRVLGSGPPLLLLHGLMTSGYSWRHVLAPLAARYTVHVPDLPGAGRSTAPGRPLTPEALSDWLLGLQKALGVVGCRIVANSMGGYLALHHALRHPTAASRIVVAHAPSRASPRLWALAAVSRLPGFRTALGALVQRDVERWVWRNVHYRDETMKSREETREYGAPLATAGGLGAFAGYLRDTMDVRGFLALSRKLRSRREHGVDFPVPLLLVYAEGDPLVPAEDGRHLARLVPDAGITWLRDVSHFAHIDRPDVYLGAIERFLAG